MSAINIDISAEDQADGDMVARLITATLTGSGFEDVTNISGPAHQDTDVEVLEAMRNLNPMIFQSEIIVDVSPLEIAPPISGEDGPGINEFPEPGPDEDDDA